MVRLPPGRSGVGRRMQKPMNRDATLGVHLRYFESLAQHHQGINSYRPEISGHFEHNPAPSAQGAERTHVRESRGRTERETMRSGGFGTRTCEITRSALRGLYKYWMGRAWEDMSDLYERV